MIINTHTKHNKKKTSKDKITHQTALKLLILCILFILAIVFYRVYINYRNNFNYLKENKSEYLVYSIYNQNNKNVPYINIKDNKIKSLNNNIATYCNKYVNLDDLSIDYEYSISGNYLSLVIRIINNEEELPEIYFKTYNIDLKNKKILKDQDLLNLYQVNYKILTKQIINHFKEMYDEEVSEGYIDANFCDYECYLKYRDIDDYLSNLNYYIKSGRLVVYKPFTFTSIFGEEDYFTKESFEFPITN